MKISSKTSYGVRFMLSLALTYDKGYVSLKDIANQEDISEKFMEAIVATLKPLGLIDVKRGSRGGYRLSKPPHLIIMKDIFDVLEGAIVNYDSSDKRTSDTFNAQAVSDYWRGLETIVIQYLETKTLDNLVEDYKKKNENQMFYI